MQINFVEDKVTLLLSLFFRRCSHLYPKAGPMSGRPPDDWPTGGCIYADSIKSSMKRLRTCRTAKDNRKCQSSNRWWEENNTKSNIWPVHEQLDPMWNYFHSSLSSLFVLTFAFSLCWWLSFLDTVVFFGNVCVTSFFMFRSFVVFFPCSPGIRLFEPSKRREKNIAWLISNWYYDTKYCPQNRLCIKDYLIMSWHRTINLFKTNKL